MRRADAHKEVPAFQPLTGTYEPSAIRRLPDGRFLVVEDEKRHPLSLVTIDGDGRVDSKELTAGPFQAFSAFWTPDDLEGPHSHDDDSDAKKCREDLIWSRVEGDRVVDPVVVD